MMLEPSSFLNSSIVGFFSLDFSHGLNDNPHKKTFPYLFHTHADCIVIIILLRGFVMTKMEIYQGVFLPLGAFLWGLPDFQRPYHFRFGEDGLLF